jgi:hypothetical protein
MLSGIIGIFLRIRLPLFSVLSLAKETVAEKTNMQNTKRR